MCCFFCNIALLVNEYHNYNISFIKAVQQCAAVNAECFTFFDRCFNHPMSPSVDNKTLGSPETGSEDSEDEGEPNHKAIHRNDKNLSSGTKAVKHVRIKDEEREEIVSPTNSTTIKEAKKKPNAKKSKMCTIL